MFVFPVSNVETWWWLPGLVAFSISIFTSTAGVSGGFLILPFQVSFLGFTGPGVSSTNQVYNIIGAPGGIYRYFREGRMVWPLTLAIIAGALPGLLIGAIIRIIWLGDPTKFKFFVGMVLLYVCARLLLDIIKRKSSKGAISGKGTVTAVKYGLISISYKYDGSSYDIPTMGIYAIAFVIGIISGAYGIGGGAIMAPLLVVIFGLPVYTVAGPALFGSFSSSVASVIIYYFIVPLFVPAQEPIKPDLLLALSFGIGGLLGTYAGARLQKFLPARIIKIFLLLGILYISTKYIIGYLGG